MKNRSGYGKFLLFFLIGALSVLSIGAFFRSVSIWSNRAVNDFFHPYLSVAAWLRNHKEDLKYDYWPKSRLLEEIKSLRAENRLLSRQAILFDEVARQNQELRSLLKLKPLPKWNSVNAEIILRDPADWFYFFTINRGSRDGVKVGAAVYTLSENYKPLLLGVVEQISQHSAKVLSIYNPDLKISGRLGGAKVIGLLNFSGKASGYSHLVSIGFLPRNEKYTAGEEIFTTGFEENIPPGLKIGNLSFWDESDSLFSNALYLNGMVTPDVNFNLLSFVTVALKQEL